MRNLNKRRLYYFYAVIAAICVGVSAFVLYQEYIKTGSISRLSIIVTAIVWASVFILTTTSIKYISVPMIKGLTNRDAHPKLRNRRNKLINNWLVCNFVGLPLQLGMTFPRVRYVTYDYLYETLLHKNDLYEIILYCGLTMLSLIFLVMWFVVISRLNCLLKVMYDSKILRICLLVVTMNPFGSFYMPLVSIDQSYTIAKDRRKINRPITVIFVVFALAALAYTAALQYGKLALLPKTELKQVEVLNKRIEGIGEKYFRLLPENAKTVSYYFESDYFKSHVNAVADDEIKDKLKQYVFRLIFDGEKLKIQIVDVDAAKLKTLSPPDLRAVIRVRKQIMAAYQLLVQVAYYPFQNKETRVMDQRIYGEDYLTYSKVIKIEDKIGFRYYYDAEDLMVRSAITSEDLSAVLFEVDTGEFEDARTVKKIRQTWGSKGKDANVRIDYFAANDIVYVLSISGVMELKGGGTEDVLRTHKVCINEPLEGDNAEDDIVCIDLRTKKRTVIKKKVRASENGGQVDRDEVKVGASEQYNKRKFGKRFFLNKNSEKNYKINAILNKDDPFGINEWDAPPHKKDRSSEV